VLSGTGEDHRVMLKRRGWGAGRKGQGQFFNGIHKKEWDQDKVRFTDVLIPERRKKTGSEANPWADFEEGYNVHWEGEDCRQQKLIEERVNRGNDGGEQGCQGLGDPFARGKKEKLGTETRENKGHQRGGRIDSRKPGKKLK